MSYFTIEFFETALSIAALCICGFIILCLIKSKIVGKKKFPKKPIRIRKKTDSVKKKIPTPQPNQQAKSLYKVLHANQPAKKKQSESIEKSTHIKERVDHKDKHLDDDFLDYTYNKAEALLDSGLDTRQVAERVKRPVGEIELIMNMKKEKQ